MPKMKFTLNSPARERSIKTEIAADPDTSEASPGEIRKMKPFRPGRPKLAAPKEHVSLRHDQQALKHYRATGAGWQSRVNADLLAVITKASAKSKL